MAAHTIEQQRGVRRAIVDGRTHHWEQATVGDGMSMAAHTIGTTASGGRSVKGEITTIGTTASVAAACQERSHYWNTASVAGACVGRHTIGNNGECGGGHGRCRSPYWKHGMCGGGQCWPITLLEQWRVWRRACRGRSHILTRASVAAGMSMPHTPLEQRRCGGGLVDGRTH
ncbi:hypothetical protein HNY73_023012 [Argiope bruennichi]|uniref:Uncharacterized protein n=1 Tax=Argiope bruennichi TaxID=94029 RepID=A0A8T0E6F3_ARGBR|nr:hypothetical protein HNY73_023012 [Argiope bruennichi]